MRSILKLPLYLGLSVMVVSVLVSAITLGEKRTVISTQSQAKIEGSDLSMIFTSPNFLTVVLTTNKDITGVDVVIKFDTDKIIILPSTLLSGTAYTTSGGIVDETSGTFSFSALRRENSSSSGPVATFNVSPLEGADSVETEFQFREGEGSSAVIDVSGGNILNSTRGIKVTVSR